MIDPATALAFSVFENPGVYALLVGSGISRSAQIATGWEITQDLVRRVATLQGVKEQPDWSAWYVETYGAEPDYASLLDELAPTPLERRAILHSYIEQRPDDETGARSPTEAHRAIAKLVQLGFIRVIITTNFDRLMENALRDAGVEPTVLASDDDLKGAVPLIHTKCCLVKIHGDYLDTRIRNTAAELASYSKSFNAYLDRILDEHGLIVCGWSADWDTALSAAITRTPNRRFPTFWAARGTLKGTAAQVAAKRTARTVPIADADSFFGGLAESVALQVEMQRLNPQSVDLMVAAAKRYVENSESRIRLHDLIAEQLRLLRQRLSLLDLMGDFAPWVGATDAALEPLARMFGVLGRWGGEDEATVALQIVDSFTRHPNANGLTHVLALRSYPAIILAYAFGLGAYAADNLKSVRRVFDLPVRDYARNPEIFLRGHFLELWEGNRGNPWLELPEFGGTAQRAMLSGHLHSVFSGWTGDYVFGRREFDLTFHGFELLASLRSILEGGTKDELVTALADSQARTWIWTPLGRVMFAEATRNELLDRWGGPEGAASLLAAGFAGKDAEHLDLATRHLRQHIGRRRLFPD